MTPIRVLASSDRVGERSNLAMRTTLPEARSDAPKTNLRIGCGLGRYSSPFRFRVVKLRVRSVPPPTASLTAVDQGPLRGRVSMTGVETISIPGVTTDEAFGEAAAQESTNPGPTYT